MELVARAAVVILAPPSAVWRALLAAETLPAIMPVTEVILPWRVGEPFEWAFELGGLGARTEGPVHRAEEDRLLEYDYVDPHSRDVLGKKNESTTLKAPHR